jgi:hypothetical protein
MIWATHTTKRWRIRPASVGYPRVESGSPDLWRVTWLELLFDYPIHMVFNAREEG